MKSKKIVKLASLAVLLLGLSGVAQAQNYGALYVNKETGIAGGSYDYPNSSQAESNAKISCLDKNKGKPGKCQLVISFANACVSVFVGENQIGAYGTHYANLNDARLRAISLCESSGGLKCKESLSFCTSR